MADINKFLPTLFKLEGGYVNDPDDAGGATNKGITIATFRSFYGQNKTVTDLKNMTNAQAAKIYKSLYWDKCKADEIENQSVAELFVDFAVNSGCKTAIRKMQRLSRTFEDGIMGKLTVQAINNKDPRKLFNELHDVRVAFYKQLVVKKPSQKKFLKGWLNRLKAYTFSE